MVGSHRYAGIRQDESAIRRYDACEGTRNPAGGSVGQTNGASSVACAAAGAVREPGDRKIGFVCIARCK